MLKEAEQEFTEIDIAKANQVDPFSKDKVVKIDTTAAAKKTAESLKYGEDLMEALELAEQFKEEIEQYEMAMEEAEKNKSSKVRPAKPRPSPLFNNRNIFEHVLLHIKAIRNAEIENTLRFLNFKQSTQLLYYLEHNIRNVRDMIAYSFIEHGAGSVVEVCAVHLGDVPAADPDESRVRAPHQVHLRAHALPLQRQEGK